MEKSNLFPELFASLQKEYPEIQYNPSTRSKSCNTNTGLRALQLLIGEETLIRTADAALNFDVMDEVARHMLIILQPYNVMEYCYQIFLSNAEKERKSDALWLLFDIADDRVLKWVLEFLSNENFEFFALRIMDQLTFKRLIYYEPNDNLVKNILSKIGDHFLSKYSRVFLNFEKNILNSFSHLSNVIDLFWLLDFHEKDFELEQLIEKISSLKDEKVEYFISDIKERFENLKSKS